MTVTVDGATYTFHGEPYRQSLRLIKTTADDDAGKRTARLEWLLKVDISSDPFLMMSHTVARLFKDYLPTIGTKLHDSDPYITCRKTHCEKVKGGVYLYTADYSNENSSEDEDEAGMAEDPLNDRPIVKPTAALKQLAIYKDRDGEAILNKAGDPILQTMDDNNIGFKIKYNVPSVPSFLGDYRNSCNDSDIVIEGLTVPSNAARMVLPSDWWSEQKIRNEIPYFVLSLDFLIDSDELHYGRPLNAGFRQLVDGDRKTIRNADGSEITEPVPLNDDGTVMENPTPETVEYLTVKKYKERDYSAFRGISAA